MYFKTILNVYLFHYNDCLLDSLSEARRLKELADTLKEELDDKEKTLVEAEMETKDLQKGKERGAFNSIYWIRCIPIFFQTILLVSRVSFSYLVA